MDRTSGADPIEAFRDAIASGNESMAQFFLDDNPTEDLINAKSARNQDTALMIAIQSKQLKMAQFLLERGANVDEQNEFDETALHIATEDGDLAAVKLLCQYDVDKRIVNEKGETALDIALFNDGELAQSLARIIEPDVAKLKQKQKENMERLKGLTSRRLASFTDGVLLLSPRTSAKLRNEEPNRALFTAELTDIANDLFADLTQHARQKAKQLPPLRSWLEKKQASPPYSWQRRWVVVIGGHILWADREITDYKLPLRWEETRRWNACHSLTELTGIEKVFERTDSKDCKFVLKSKQRDYIFRCSTQNHRDYWVKAVHQHCEQLKRVALLAPPNSKGRLAPPTGRSRRG